MHDLEIQRWCQERIRLVAGLLTALELKESQIPASAENTERHFLCSALVKKRAITYIEQLQREPVQMYSAYPHEVMQLQPGGLLVPSPEGYSSLPWRSEELPTTLHLLAMQAEAITNICNAQNTFAHSSWMLDQIQSQLNKLIDGEASP
ncbi:MAG: hypothetical protein Q8T09_11140 [Candidatus Melainabacteria bacterium]|nr:hypothetical protein [Candidatus Melainabacteria bacterium]